ncbi:MAG: transposase, partial [Actinomycetota bacterium]|nr:transposase [Actinomycetota bacterium]
WKLTDHKAAIDRLQTLAGELAHSHPGAAASLREGLAETVTLQRLGVHQQLWKSLSSTNPIESMIAICRATSRNVKHWQNGDMCLRWTAAGMLEAEHQFRKIIGYKHLAALANAVENELAATRAPSTSPTTSPPAVTSLLHLWRSESPRRAAPHARSGRAGSVGDAVRGLSLRPGDAEAGNEPVRALGRRPERGRATRRRRRPHPRGRRSATRAAPRSCVAAESSEAGQGRLIRGGDRPDAVRHIATPFAG